MGEVPDRGGVPEGYTLEDVAKDVTKANVGLAMKDAPSGGKGAQTMVSARRASWMGWAVRFGLVGSSARLCIIL